MSRMPVVLCGLLMCLSGTMSKAAAQSTDETDATALPVSIDRIRKALGREPSISTDTSTAQPTFRVRIEENLPVRIPFFTPRDVSVGVLPPGPMSHYEFLRMVTPEQARPYAAFNQKELAIVTATTIANALIAKAAVAGIRAARTSMQQRRLERLRREIAADVAAIEAAAGCSRPDTSTPPLSASCRP
jgi:hypothetical protein